jgi:hypothetical protein
MSQKPGRGSLIFGVALISIGALFLMESWLGLSWLWSLVVTWWPLLLIAFGLHKIIRYFTYSTR